MSTTGGFLYNVRHIPTWYRNPFPRRFLKKWAVLVNQQQKLGRDMSGDTVFRNPAWNHGRIWNIYQYLPYQLVQVRSANGLLPIFTNISSINSRFLENHQHNFWPAGGGVPPPPWVGEWTNLISKDGFPCFFRVLDVWKIYRWLEQLDDQLPKKTTNIHNRCKQSTLVCECLCVI